ncbi:class I SAM-dependent methyltransferase [bacterium]|nr:class I SAM-dependent methyltransferase [bacterium]
MRAEEKTRICPVERAGGLEHSFRRLLQNPRRILKPYVSQGMTVLDLGCGPGFFSLELASMLFDSGKVIASDVQEGMLDKVRQKIAGTAFESKIQLHRCREKSIGVTEQVDLILAFYMVHEVPNKDRLFGELKSILKQNGKIFIAEPSFRVPKQDFEETVEKAKSVGFKEIKRPKLLFSRSVVLVNPNHNHF